MKLTATWLMEQDPNYDMPNSICWDDGRLGTYEEFREHYSDTSFSTDTPNGSHQMHIFPDIVGEVYYCEFGRVWGLRGEGVNATSLGLTDPVASDNQIYCALLSLPIQYRATITR